MTSSGDVPALTSGEIDDLLAEFAIADANGRSPDDAEWSPTYAMRSAAAEGWRRKAGKASPLQSTDLDGDRMSSNQIFEHCLAMAKRYAGTACVPLRKT